MSIKFENYGQRIHSLQQLNYAAQSKRAVICNNGFLSHRPFPAAFVLNLSGSQILQAIRRGLFIYIKNSNIK